MFTAFLIIAIMYPELKYLKHQNLGKTMKRLEKFLYQKIRASHAICTRCPVWQVQYTSL